MRVPPYNPLDKRNIAESVVQRLLSRPSEPLPPPRKRGSTRVIPAFEGAGIYALYYSGPFDLYETQAKANRNVAGSKPIYIGKADPKGGRRGDVEADAGVGTALYDRLREHATSISQADNLELSDFSCRHLAVDEVWIGLAERLAIREYLPTWNTLVDGFGIHDPGRGRARQARSDWDMLHPGRSYATRLPTGKSVDAIRRDVLAKHSAEELAARAATVESNEEP